MCLAAVKYDLPAIIRVRHHDLVQRAQFFTKCRVGDCTAAGQGQHGVPRAEHPAFQRRGPRACPQVKPDAPPCDGRVGKIVDTHSLDEAMAAARRNAGTGDVVLLSPACASFDLFKNYEDRGRQFKEWVAAAQR